MDMQLKQRARLIPPLSAALRNVAVELGWRTAQPLQTHAIWRGFPLNRAASVDCDMAAIVCDAAGRMVQGVDCQVQTYGDAIVHHRDGMPQTCGSEKITIDFEKLPNRVGKVALVMNLYNVTENGQHLGMLRDGFIRLLDGETGQLLYKLDLPNQYKQMQGLIVGEFNNNCGRWCFTPAEQPVADAQSVQNLYMLYV